LRWWLVFDDALQVFNRSLSDRFLVVNYILQLFKLLIDFLDYLSLERFLVDEAVLKIRTVRHCFRDLSCELFKLHNLRLCSLFHCHSVLVDVLLVEEAVIAECLVVGRPTKNRDVVCMLARLYLNLKLNHLINKNTHRKSMSSAPADT